MKCSKPGCGEEINVRVSRDVLRKYADTQPILKPAHPCVTCGRLYFNDGQFAEAILESGRVLYLLLDKGGSDA